MNFGYFNYVLLKDTRHQIPRGGIKFRHSGFSEVAWRYLHYKSKPQKENAEKVE